MNSWDKYESQLFLIYGNPNKRQSNEDRMSRLSMKENNRVSTYIASFRALQAHLPDWNDQTFFWFFRRGLPSRILDKLSRHPKELDTLQDLLDASLKIDVRFHERRREKQKENPGPAAKKEESLSKNSNNSNSSKKPSASKKGESSSDPKPNSAPPSRVPDHIRKVVKDGKLLPAEKERRMKLGLCLYDGESHDTNTCEKALKNQKNL